jgi:hypothetical protein
MYYKKIYLKNIDRDKLNNILYGNICYYILIEIYNQNKLYE